MNNNIIEIKNLKKYFGRTKAVDGISFAVKKGEIFGFLGPNGAGKTTTIRCLMDFIRPVGGSISILGKDAQTDSVELKEKIGYLPGIVHLYDKWTGREHIDFYEKIRGKSKIVGELLKKFELDPKPRFKHLSSGNKQKLGLVLALMHEPEILVLDEPTISLDPILQNMVLETLLEFKARGHTVFMSSHNLPEVERVADRVGIIKLGKMIAVEKVENITKKRIHVIYAYFSGPYKKSDFTGDGIKIFKEMKNGLVLHVKGDLNPVIAQLKKYKITDLEITHATLEDVFMEYYNNG